jgi:site-specific recombinase XerC
MAMDAQPFLDFMTQVRSCSPATIKSYRNDLKIIFDHLLEQGVTMPRQIDQHVVAGLVSWMREQRPGRGGNEGLAESSISRRMAVLSSYLDWAQLALNPDIQNPIKNLSFRWKKDRSPKPVDDDSLDFLLANIENLRDKALYYLLVASGLRVSEVHQLRNL